MSEMLTITMSYNRGKKKELCKIKKFPAIYKPLATLAIKVLNKFSAEHHKFQLKKIYTQNEITNNDPCT